MEELPTDVRPWALGWRTHAIPLSQKIAGDPT